MWGWTPKIHLVFVVFYFHVSPILTANYKLPHSESVVADLFSQFELQLQDSIFEALERESHGNSLGRSRSHHRTRRSNTDEPWTGFVPDLFQHRDQLVVDSLRIVSSEPICQDVLTGGKILLDSVQHRRKHYTLAVCGDRLSLYRVNSTGITFLDEQKILGDEAVWLTHAKLFDPDNGDVLLFLLVLTPKSLEIYTCRNERIELSHSQELLSQYSTVQLFEFHDTIYCMLLKTNNRKSQPGFFTLNMDNGRLSFNFVSSKSLPDIKPARMCVVDDQGFMLQSSTDKLNIYLFDGRHLESHQFINAPAIKDYRCFNVGATQYLTVLTERWLKVFQYVDGFYEALQTIDRSAISSPRQPMTSVLPISPPTYRDETVLLVSGPGFVDLLLFNASTLEFQPTKSTCSQLESKDFRDLNILPLTFHTRNVACLAETVRLDLWPLTSIVMNQRAMLLVAKDSRILLLDMEASLQPVTNPIGEQLRHVRERLEDLTDAAREIEARSQDFTEFSKGIILYGSDVRLEGSWSVEAVAVPSMQLENVDDVDFNPDVWIPGLDLIVKDLQRKKGELEILISGIDQRLQGAIINGTTEPLEFHDLIIDGSVSIQQLHASNLTVERINGQSFEFVLNDVVRTNSDRVIESVKIIGTLSAEAVTAERVNGILVKDALVDGDLHIFGDLTIYNTVKVSGDVLVNGTVNGIDLDSQLMTFDQLHESIVFQDGVTVDHLIVNGLLDNVQLDKVLPNIVTNQSIDIEFHGHVHFDHLTIDGALEISSNRIDGIDVVALNASAVMLNVNQTVLSSIEFTNGSTLQQSLTVGSLNGIKFEEIIPKVADLSNVTMTGRKVFKGPVRARSVTVAGRVNGHRLENALTLDTDQNITGAMFLPDGFDVSGDLTVGSVNGANWTMVREMGVHPALLMQKPGLVKNVTMRNPWTINGTLIPSHVRVDGEDLANILANLVYSDEEEVVITGEKRFASWNPYDLQVDGYINGMKLLDELLTSNTPQIINGRYELLRDVEFYSLNVSGDLNQYNVDKLLGSVLRFDSNKQDTIKATCRLRFDQVQVTGKTIVDGSINGVKTERMVLNGIDQTFTAPQELVSPNFLRLSVGGDLLMPDVTSRINDIELDLFDRRRVTVTTDQWIKGAWNVDNATIHSLSVDRLNGLPLIRWNADFIRSHSASPQVISAKDVHLDELVVHGNINTASGVSGYDFVRLNRTAADIREDIFFNGDVVFENLEATGNVQVAGTVNEYRLQDLKGDLVQKKDDPTQPIVVTGVKTFQQLKVSGDIEVELVNGLRLIDSFLHTSADQTIETHIQFANQVTAGDLRLTDSATLNGVPSPSLFSSQTLTHNVYRGDVILNRSISVNHLETLHLQGEKFDQLITSLAWLNKTNHFDGTVTFTNQFQVNGALNAGHVNGVDLVTFADDVVLRDEDAVIPSKKVFERVETSELFSTDGVAHCDSVEPNIIQTAADAVRLDRDEFIVGPVTFIEPIRVTGDVHLVSLNGLNFPSDYVSLNGDQELLGSSFTVDRISVLQSIEFADGARLNGFNLTAECANAWLIDDDRAKLQSTKTFQGKLHFSKDLSVKGTINKRSDFDREVVELSKGGTIHGASHWMDVLVNSDVDSVDLTNDIDLADLANKALYLDQPISTASRWSMKQAVVSGSHFLQPVEADINNLPFSVGQLIGKNDSNSNESIQMEERKLMDAAGQWHEAFRRSYFKLDHVDLNQTLFMPHQVTSVSQLQLLRNTSLLLVGTRAGSMVFRRRSNESSYSLAAIPTGTGSVSKWLPLPPDHIAGLLTPTPIANVTGARLWRITSADPLAFEQVLDFGPDVVDITGEAIHNLRFVYRGNATRSLPIIPLPGGQPSQLQVYERDKMMMTNAFNPFSSDVKMHNFRMGSKQMIALVMAFSAEVSVSLVGCPGVRLYGTSTGSLKLEQIIPACDVRAVATFTHGNLPDHYLLLAEHEAVIMYHYQGAAGFVERLRLPYPTAAALHAWVDADGQVTVAVGKADRVAIHVGVNIGDYIRD